MVTYSIGGSLSRRTVLLLEQVEVEPPRPELLPLLLVSSQDVVAHGEVTLGTSTTEGAPLFSLRSCWEHILLVVSPFQGAHAGGQVLHHGFLVGEIPGTHDALPEAGYPITASVDGKPEGVPLRVLALQDAVKVLLEGLFLVVIKGRTRSPSDQAGPFLQHDFLSSVLPLLELTSGKGDTGSVSQVGPTASVQPGERGRDLLHAIHVIPEHLLQLHPAPRTLDWGLRSVFFLGRVGRT